MRMIIESFERGMKGWQKSTKKVIPTIESTARLFQSQNPITFPFGQYFSLWEPPQNWQGTSPLAPLPVGEGEEDDDLVIFVNLLALFLFSQDKASPL